jgi:hypothetical protein
MSRHPSDESSEPSDAITTSDSEFQQKRERLAKLLGRLLARHLLRRQTEPQDCWSADTKQDLNDDRPRPHLGQSSEAQGQAE